MLRKQSIFHSVFFFFKSGKFSVRRRCHAELVSASVSWVYCIKAAFVSLLLLGFFSRGTAQNVIPYARQVVDTLASPSMHGRGYVNHGNEKAAMYIQGQYRKIGLEKFTKNYFQHFSFPVNTFPDEVSVKINDSLLDPGAAYIVLPETGTIKGTYGLVRFDKHVVEDQQALNQFKSKDLSNKFVVVDSTGIRGKEEKELFEELRFNPFKAKGVILLVGKLTQEMSEKVDNYALLAALRDSFPKNARTITLDIKNKFIKHQVSQNIAGYVKGTQFPDSFVVFTAHYDHLGQMGKDAYFPGANDNASGIAMLLNLAKYFKKHPPVCSVAFIAFSAEEMGLVGSKYYTEHPLFPLKQIKFLVNMDMVGTGDDGIKVVDGTVFKTQFDTLQAINNAHNYLKSVQIRGKAANSDHYFFYKKGVPAIFIYTLGGIKAYHDIYDRRETLPLTKFENLFHLLTDFTAYLAKS